MVGLACTDMGDDVREDECFKYRCISRNADDGGYNEAEVVIDVIKCSQFLGCCFGWRRSIFSGFMHFCLIV